MPLDTSIIRQATFQPIQFKSPDRVNMLLQAAQAAQAVQGLQAGQEEREARIAGQQRAAAIRAEGRAMALSSVVNAFSTVAGGLYNYNMIRTGR